MQKNIIFSVQESSVLVFHVFEPEAVNVGWSTEFVSRSCYYGYNLPIIPDYRRAVQITVSKNGWLHIILHLWCDQSRTWARIVALDWIPVSISPKLNSPLFIFPPADWTVVTVMNFPNYVVGELSKILLFRDTFSLTTMLCFQLWKQAAVWEKKGLISWLDLRIKMDLSNRTAASNTPPLSHNHLDVEMCILMYMLGSCR